MRRSYFAPAFSYIFLAGPSEQFHERSAGAVESGGGAGYRPRVRPAYFTLRLSS